jgi:hypothetical protein
LAWIRHNVEHLRRWREYAEALAAAACRLRPGAVVYVVGSIARGEPTVASDIDVLIVIPDPGLRPEDKPRLAAEIFNDAVERHGLPWDAPVEIHLATPREAERYLKGQEAVMIRSCTRASPAPKTRSQG